MPSRKSADLVFSILMSMSRLMHLHQTLWNRVIKFCPARQCRDPKTLKMLHSRWITRATRLLKFSETVSPVSPAERRVAPIVCRYSTTDWRIEEQILVVFSFWITRQLKVSSRIKANFCKGHQATRMHPSAQVAKAGIAFKITMLARRTLQKPLSHLVAPFNHNQVISSSRIK